MMKFQFLIVTLIFIAFQSAAQFADADYQLLSNCRFENLQFDARHPSFMKVGNNIFTRYNPVSLTLGGLLYVYQKVISPQLQSDCPYEISCSAFSKACIQEFGVLKGVALTADRLSRCTQFTIPDIDPSRFNPKNNKIIDPVEKYRVKHHHY
ncbi:MAG: membrane protein insertion efficiency factor YidD [Flavobacteriales bacterium]